MCTDENNGIVGDYPSGLGGCKGNGEEKIFPENKLWTDCHYGTSSQTHNESPAHLLSVEGGGHSDGAGEVSVQAL
jgi:hypothetical protein